MNTDLEAFKALAAAISDLPPGKQEFARSLLAQHEARTLSEKQMHWVRKLAQEAIQPAAVALGDLSGVIALFDAAKAQLRFPKVRLQLEDGRPLAIAIGGSASKRPGVLHISNGKSFNSGKSVYYGWVGRDGTWNPTSKADTSITALLSAFAQDPAGIGAMHGRRTGNCCFCARDLTDQRSVKMGYGPICAAKWNLPWGE